VFDAVVCFGGPISYVLDEADRGDADDWDDPFLEIEVAACREPGAHDGGTHILVAVERL
jgi:hypothetical protein